MFSGRLSGGLSRPFSSRSGYGDRFDDPFFPPLIGGRPSFVSRISGGVNARAAWEEAEIFLFNKLLAGIHPDEIEERVRRDISMPSQSSYRYAFLRAIIGQLIMLRASSSLRDMPSMRDQAQMDRVDRLRFLLGMRNRFTDTISFRRYTVDDEMARELSRSRALNREAVEELRFLRQREQAQTEEQYRANEEALLAELAIAAEIRLNRDLNRNWDPRGEYIAPPGRQLPGDYYDSPIDGGWRNNFNVVPDILNRGIENDDIYNGDDRENRYQPDYQRFPRDFRGDVGRGLSCGGDPRMDIDPRDGMGNDGRNLGRGPW